MILCISFKCKINKHFEMYGLNVKKQSLSNLYCTSIDPLKNNQIILQIIGAKISYIFHSLYRNWNYLNKNMGTP